jgi:flagellar protein FlaG
MDIQGLNNLPVTNGQTTAPSASPGPRPASASPPAVTPAHAPSHADVGKAVDAINQKLEESGQSLRFSLDQQSGQTVVRVVDAQTNELIRQIPTEVALAISHSLERLQGLLVKQRA